MSFYIAELLAWKIFWTNNKINNVITYGKRDFNDRSGDAAKAQNKASTHAAPKTSEGIYKINARAFSGETKSIRNKNDPHPPRRQVLTRRKIEMKSTKLILARAAYIERSASNEMRLVFSSGNKSRDIAQTPDELDTLIWAAAKQGWLAPDEKKHLLEESNRLRPVITGIHMLIVSSQGRAVMA